MRVDNNQLQFSVKDSGIGIPLDKQNFIFERFAQVESCNTRLHGGTGLGLPIVKGLLDILGSSISLNSEVGKGVCLHLQYLFKCLAKYNVVFYLAK